MFLSFYPSSLSLKINIFKKRAGEGLGRRRKWQRLQMLLRLTELLLNIRWPPSAQPPTQAAPEPTPSSAAPPAPARQNLKKEKKKEPCSLMC